MRLDILYRKSGMYPSAAPELPLSTYLAAIAASSDDAEEVLDPADGSIFTSSLDLELGEDDARGAQVVGLRWLNVGIRRGAPVNSASIRFKARDSSSAKPILRIWAQAIPNPATFTTAEENISSRTKTAAFVDWQTTSWTAGSRYETPDLSSLVSAVTNNPGWTEGDAIAFLIETSPNNTVAAPRKSAASFDDSPADAPTLAINRSHGDVSGGVGTSTFSLEGDAGFDTANPTMADGTVLAGTSQAAFDGLKWCIDNAHQGSPQTRYLDQGISLDALAALDDTYLYSRSLAQVYSELFVALRSTGWLGFLDEAVRIADIQYAQLDVGWRDYDASEVRGGGSDQHSYLCWVWRPGNGGLYGGTDYHLDTARAHAPIAQLAWALHLNRGKPSPGGYDYEAKANQWEGYLVNHFLPVWQGHDGLAWQDHYHGNDHDFFVRNGVGGRPDYGEWPILSRSYTHSSVGMSTLHYFLGKLLGDQDCIDVGLEGINECFLQRNVYTYTGSFGTQKTFPREQHWTGHHDQSNPGHNYHQPLTYGGYVVMDMVNMWLEGAISDADDRLFVGLTRTLNQYTLGLTPSGGTSADAIGPGDLAGNTDMTGGSAPVNDDGQALDMPGADVNGFDGYRSNGNSMSDQYPLLLPWDTPEAELEVQLRGIMETDAGQYGTFDQPKVLAYPIGRLLKLENASAWEPTLAGAPGFSSDGLDSYDLTVNESFDTGNPTLKDGTPITGDMLTYYNAMISWAESDPTGSWVYVNLVNRLSHENIYEMARWGSNCWSAIIVAYRLTGDPRLLDKLTEAAIALKNSLVIEWDGYDQSAYEANNDGTCFTGTPWAPYLKKLRVGSAGGTFWGTGTDGHPMNEERYSAIIAEAAWLFHVNRGKSTPGGYDFAAEADFWAARCEDFVRKWSALGDVGDCWESNYHGNNYKRASRDRAAAGEWPACVEEGDVHSTWEGLRAHHYFEALRGVGWSIPPGAAAQRDEFCDDLGNFLLIACTTSYGDSLVMKRSWKALGDSSDVAVGATYMGYVSWSLLQIWLAGYRRDVFTTDLMTKITRSYAEILHSDGATDYSMIGNTAKCGLDPEDSGKAIDAGSNAIKGLGAGLIAWDTPDGHINAVATNVQNNVAGTYDTPDSGLFPAGQFVAEALKALGDV